MVPAGPAAEGVAAAPPAGWPSLAEGGKCQCGMIQLEYCWFGQAQVSWTGRRAGGVGRVKVLLELRTRQRAELSWEL